MKTLAQLFAQHWKEYHFRNQGTVLLALSGGVDSMVLAHLLLENHIVFAAAHCNFSLREEAEEDASFVASWCREHNIVCHQIRFDTKEYAASHKQSIQIAARLMRYDWFESLRKEHGYEAILTAHHSDDVAETLLINLCRGTGIGGLHGIPERNGFIIRPMLFARKEAILEYAQKNQITWREDESNASDKYLRNAFRHRVMPLLEELAPGSLGRIAQTAFRLKGAEQIFHQEIKHRLERIVEKRGLDSYIPIRLLQKQEALPTLAFELFHPYGFTPEQIPQILELMQAESGSLILSPTHRVLRHREFLVLNTLANNSCDLIQIDEIPTSIETTTGIFHFEWSDIPLTVPTTPLVAYLNSESFSLPLTIRPRRDGDYFYPLGMGMKKKKIKRFLIDQKLGIHEKERIRILECNGKIMWIAGLRIDERFKIKPSCIKALKITIQPIG